MIMLTFTTWMVAHNISSAFVSSPHYHVRHSNSILHKASTSVQSEQHSFSFDEIKAVESRYVVSLFICYVHFYIVPATHHNYIANGAGVDSNISKENHPIHCQHSMNHI